MTLNPEIRELTTYELDDAAGGCIEVLIGLGLIALGAVVIGVGSGALTSPASNEVWDHIPH